MYPVKRREQIYRKCTKTFTMKFKLTEQSKVILILKSQFLRKLTYLAKRKKVAFKG